MTIGEKIREARKNAGLTQAQMAEKISVSRQAITKWESDRGIPDIANLKEISSLLNISIDYLLDNNTEYMLNTIKEEIDLTKYGKKFKKKIKDRIVREKYPDAEVRILLASKIKDKTEKIMQNVLCCISPISNAIDIMNSFKLVGNEFYLVSQKEKQFLVKVSDEFIESRQLTEKINMANGEKFIIDEYSFMICGVISS